MPAIVAPVYDWSGPYLGLNGGGASSTWCYTITTNNGIALSPPTPSEGCHDATGGLVRLARSAIAGRQPVGCSAIRSPGRLGQPDGIECESLTVLIPATNRTKIDAIGPHLHRPGLATPGTTRSLVREGQRRGHRQPKYSTFFTASGVVYNQATDTRWGGVVWLARD